jgi:hypothetical protein
LFYINKKYYQDEGQDQIYNNLVEYL